MKSEFCWNFWGPPNLSSSCDNNYAYVKHVSFKSVIFRRYKMKKNRWEFMQSRSPTRQHPLKKIACGAGLRRFCQASAFIAGVPVVCQILAWKAVFSRNLNIVQQGTVKRRSLMMMMIAVITSKSSQILRLVQIQLCLRSWHSIMIDISFLFFFEEQILAKKEYT